MASIRIRNRSSSGGIPGLTKGELAVNLADGVLWVGGTTDTPIYLSGVQTFNGLTGAVTGVTVGGFNVFTQLNTFQAGISASGATLGRLVVSGGISAAGGITFNSLSHFTQGLSAASVSRFHEIVVNNVGQFNSQILAYNGLSIIQGKTTLFDLEVSAGAGITINSLSHFTQGLSGSGATLGRLVVNSGISASGGVTFHNNVWVGGPLIAADGLEALGGVTFYNDVSVGNNLSVGNDLSYSGELKRAGQAVSVITPYGSTNDLPRPGVQGEVVFVTGSTLGYPGYGLYIWDGGASFEAGGVRGAWVRVTNGNDYRYSIDNGDGVIDGIDLANLLAAWGDYTSGGAYAPGSSQTFAVGIGDGLEDAFEVKVFGATAGKKTSAFKITSNDAEPIIFMNSLFTAHDGLFIVDKPDDLALSVPSGWAEFGGGLYVIGGGSTFDTNVSIGGLLTLNSGLSAGCGVTFNCLTHHTRGLSASGATLGTLVVNGGATFNGPVYMGTTLTMNSNIRFNSGFGITGGFIDAGWY